LVTEQPKWTPNPQPPDLTDLMGNLTWSAKHYLKNINRWRQYSNLLS